MNKEEKYPFGDTNRHPYGEHMIAKRSDERYFDENGVEYTYSSPFGCWGVEWEPLHVKS